MKEIDEMRKTKLKKLFVLQLFEHKKNKIRH